MLQTISAAVRTTVPVMFVVLVVLVAYLRGWPTALIVAAGYLLLGTVVVLRNLHTAVPARPQHLGGLRATYVLAGGRAVIEARVTGRARNRVELSNHVKVPGTPTRGVRAMRRTLIAALLATNPPPTLRMTTRVPALARLYAQDLDAVAESLGLEQRSLIRPARAWERLVGLHTEIRLETSAS